MAEEESPFLTAEELRRLDSEYQPIPSFGAWAEGIGDFSETWEHVLEVVGRFNETRRDLPGDKADDIVRAAMRAAAFNTGAIEGLHKAGRGLTITVMEEAAGWQAAVSRMVGTEAAMLTEAALQGYEMALDFTTGRHAFTEAWIRRIHEVICEPQATYQVITPQGLQVHPLERGTYKRSPNHVMLSNGSLHPYAPVASTPDEMHRLVEQFASEEFGGAHPALQAAYAHHMFTMIHPFADGNGRVARVLTSVFTLRWASVPFVVFDDQKAWYFNALERADAGQVEDIINFVCDRVVDILDYLTESMKGSQKTVPGQVAQLRAVMTGHGGLSHSQIDSLAFDLQTRLGQTLASVISEYSLPVGVSAEPRNYNWFDTGAPEGTREVDKPTANGARMEGPYNQKVMVSVNVFISKGTSARFPFTARVTRRRLQNVHVDRHTEERVVELSGEQTDVPVRLDEVFPSASSILDMRMEALLRRFVAEAVEDLTVAIEKSLRKHGVIE